MGVAASVPSQQLGPPSVVLPAWKRVRYMLTAIPGLGEAHHGASIPDLKELERVQIVRALATL